MPESEETIDLFFLAHHALMITDKEIKKHGLPYDTGNILLLNRENRMILPYNLIQGDAAIGPMVDQNYQLTLTAPPGELPDHLKTVMPGLDTTLLYVHQKKVGASGVPVIHFPSPGRGTYITHDMLQERDVQRILDLYNEDNGLQFRITKAEVI
ncbi:hypothetical protein GF367_01490 [Candidatus Woesearchaeota archaeon]|nr:hypothetical protein [Candidatus Woesearchaeota archaeon]